MAVSQRQNCSVATKPRPRRNGKRRRQRHCGARQWHSAVEACRRVRRVSRVHVFSCTVPCGGRIGVHTATFTMLLRTERCASHHGCLTLTCWGAGQLGRPVGRQRSHPPPLTAHRAARTAHRTVSTASIRIPPSAIIWPTRQPMLPSQRISRSASKLVRLRIIASTLVTVFPRLSPAADHTHAGSKAKHMCLRLWGDYAC